MTGIEPTETIEITTETMRRLTALAEEAFRAMEAANEAAAERVYTGSSLSAAWATARYARSLLDGEVDDV